jgi:intracellular multiplication protein IcmD
MFKLFIRFFILMFLSFHLFADTLSLGDLAENITKSFESITKLLTAGAYVGGVTFFIVAVFQFKQHKENPTQVPLSKPMMILAMSSALIFLPDFVNSVSATIFGEQGGNANPSGFLPGYKI